MNGILQTINAFFESQSGMFWLIVVLFALLVFVSVARVVAVGNVDKLRDSLSEERTLSSGYKERMDYYVTRNAKLHTDNAQLAKIAGDAQEEVENIKYRNTKLLGANEMLADAVMNKIEFISAIGMAAERACSTCQTRACNGCEIRAMRGVYLEPQAEEPDPVAKNPAEGLPYRSCAWCVRAAECREDGGLEYNMPPMLNENQDIDCYNFAFDEKTVPQDEQPEEPTVCGTSCPTCSKEETCDKTAGSGYQPDGRDGCANWENWKAVEGYGMVEDETP
jgi:hypothetical protein